MRVMCAHNTHRKGREYIMLSDMLIKNIENMVTRIGIVYEDQILQMFKNTHSLETIQWCLRTLVNQNHINYDPNKRIYKRRQWVSEKDLEQRLRTQAAWVLAYMGDDSVREYWVDSYPCQLLIIAEDDTVYDVTMFTYQTLKSLKLVVCKKRKQMIPEGVDDEIVHLAVLPDKEMAEDIRMLGFDSYCILDKSDSQPIYYQWE